MEGVADTPEASVTPILIGRDPRDLDPLGRAIKRYSASGRSYFADAILDPIHHGFTESIVRYRDLRQRYPAAPIMMASAISPNSRMPIRLA